MIPDYLVCPDGYSIVRKDRTDCRGGGVAIICRKIVMQNSNVYVAAIYHPPDCDYDETDLIEYLIDTCEQILSSKPNSRLIIAGDINKLNIIRNLLHQLPATQLVKVPTRGQNILDVFITNAHYDWKQVKVVKSLVRTDHDMIITYPRDVIEAVRRNSYFREARQHDKMKMLSELQKVDWYTINTDGQTLDEMMLIFYETVWPIFKMCFPLIKVRTSSTDPPFMSPLVKHLLKKRKRAIQKGDSECQPRLQEQINKLIRKNQLNAVKQRTRVKKLHSYLLIPNCTRQRMITYTN